MDRPLSVVAIGAHPDDLELFMWGTLLRFKEEGHRVVPVVLTDGRRAGPKGMPGAEIAALRRTEALASAALAGFEPRFLDLVNGEVLDDAESRRRVGAIFEELRPDLVLCHDPADYHPEHRLASRLAVDLAWAPVLFADTMAGLGFQPEHCVDVSAHFGLKRRCILEHASQRPEELLRIAEIMGRFRGLQCDWKGAVEFAEAFRVYPRIGSARALSLLPR